ncbi:MAG: HD domain-containing protein [Patescibacteria group bacterium]
MLTRQQALRLLHQHTKNQNLCRHMYAVGFVMRTLAEKLNGNPEEWEVLGLLHDADWEETKEKPDEHTKHTINWLKELGITEGSLVHALMSHNRIHTNLAELEGKMEWSLETCDELTGFIVAVTLVRPEKLLASVKLESVLKKWKNKEFAKAVDRLQIAQCEEKLGILLNEFIQISLSAMQEHHKELGL